MAIIFTPGQVVSDADWEPLRGQHGDGQGPPQKRAPSNQEQAAALAAANAAAPLGEGEVPDPNDPRKWYLRYETNPIYRQHYADGSWVEYRSAENGTDAVIVDYHPSPQFQAAQRKQEQGGNAPPGGKPYMDEEGPNGRRREWDPNAYGPGVGGYTKDIGASPSAQAAAAGASETKPLEGYPGWNVAVIKEGPNTRTVYLNPQGREAQDPRPAAAPPEGEVREELNVNGQRVIKVTTKNAATNRAETYYTDAEGRRIPPPGDKADLPKAELAPDGSYGYWDRSGPVPKWVAIPPSDAPAIMRKPEFVKGAGYGVWVPGEGGIPRFQPVLTVKPTDIPVLQAKYGEVARGLGQLAAELNGRVARGEMTEEQKNEAFTQAHQQASTLVEETNTLLGTSKAIWAQEIAQRGQTFTEAANRRSFAGNVLDNALGQGAQMARGALPSGAKAIAGAVGAMLSIGQQYAQGMGGFPDMAEVRMPRALEQARDVGLPGMGGPPAAPGVPPGAGAAPQISTWSTSPGVPAGAPAGGPNAIGVGGIGDLPPPGAPAPGPPPVPGGPAPVAPPAPPSPSPPPPVAPAPLPPAPPVGGPPTATLPQAPPQRDDWRLTPAAPTLPPVEQGEPYRPGSADPTPVLEGMGARMGSGMAGSPMGMPAAMGGGGYFDPAAEMQSMMSASTSPTSFGGAGVADPDWEDAVRRAYADASKYGGF